LKLDRSLVVVPALALSLFGCGNSAADRGDLAELGKVPTGNADQADDGMSTAPAVVLRTAIRVVEPGGEIYACQDFENPFGTDVAVVESTSTMTHGAHHMFAFVLGESELSFYGNMTDCPSGGLEFHDYLHTSQIPSDRVTYPADVGRLLSAGSGIRIMLHLLNTATEPVEASIDFKMHYVDPSAVGGKAASMFLNNLGLKVPAGKSTQAGTYTVPKDIALLRGSSHMHRHGARFVATVSDGTMLYESNVWEEPVPRVFDPPLPIAMGTQIKWSCDFENDTGSTLAFGESASKNEMCIFSAMFYDATGAQLTAQFPFF
jgi:hypothetical protein